MDLKKIYKFISYNVLVVISVWIFSVYFMDFNPTFFWIDSNWYLFFDLFPGNSHGSLNFSFYISLAWGTIGFFHFMYIVTNNSLISLLTREVELDVGVSIDVTELFTVLVVAILESVTSVLQKLKVSKNINIFLIINCMLIV